MAHELSFTNGVADFFAVRQSAWHREGTLLDEAPSFDQALEIAKLDYEVTKLPTFRQVGPAEAPDYVQSDLAFVTYRADRAIELGMVGKDYTVVQNRDAFAALRPLVDEGILHLETGGVLREGADAWLLGRFDIERFGPVVREVFADEVLPYVCIAANHNGRRGNLVALTPIRVVCANTMGFMEGSASEADSIKVRHTGDAEARTIEAAERLVGGIIERYETVAQAYRTLKGFYLDQAMLRELVIEPAIGPHPTKRHGWNPEARMAEAVVVRWERKAAEIERLWSEGKGHTGDGSAWEAYSGLVEAIDHNEELFPRRGGVYRTQQLMDGELRRMKDRAMGRLLAAAEAR